MFTSTTMFVFLSLFIHLIPWAKGMDAGVHELRSVGTSVMKRTLSSMYQNNYDLPQQVDALIELFKDNPWAFLQLRGSSRHTRGRDRLEQPRMGRDDQMVFTETSRSPPFAPRLGRDGIPLIPRVGRILISPN